MQDAFYKCLTIIAMVCVLAIGSNAWAEAVIYEPFADGDSSLTGNTPGTGLTGTWTAAGPYTIIANQTYGDLISSGSGAKAAGGWASSSIAIDTNAAAYTALLADGGDMWFGLLYRTDQSSRFAFAISDNGFGAGNGYLANTPADQAIGFGMCGLKLCAGIFTAGRWSGNNLQYEANNAIEPKYLATSTGQTYLVVGHVEWGAIDATDYDTVTLYTPDTSLEMGSAVAVATGIVSQSSFKILGTHNLSSLSLFDEIRVGASYADVVGLAAVINLSNDTVASNAPIGSLVGTLSMGGDDGVFTYALDTTGDYEYFDIAEVGATNKLRTAKLMDAASYSISIIGTEQGGGGLVVTNDSITVTVTPKANDEPTFIVATDVQGGAADGTVVGTAQTIESGTVFSISAGREDLFYFDGAELKVTNSANWGSVGTTNFVTLQAVFGAATNELVVAVGVVSGATSGTVFRFH